MKIALGSVWGTNIFGGVEGGERASKDLVFKDGRSVTKRKRGEDPRKGSRLGLDTYFPVFSREGNLFPLGEAHPT